MLKLVFKNFIRSKGTKLGLIFLFLISLLSLLIGLQFKEKQEQNLIEAQQYQKQQLERNARFHKDEIGLLLYYNKFSIANKTFPTNGLSIGQRDVNPSIQSVTIRGLEAQKYDSELTNVASLLIGNFDFSFVFIYLFPLLIIAFTYNIISEEKESGTWKLVATQTGNLLVYILQMFYVRVLSFVLLFTVLLLLALLVLKIPIDGSLLLFYGIGILYLLFWFSLTFYIVSWQRNSNFNAGVLISIWLFLLVIFPAVISNLSTSVYPIPESLSLSLKQRKAYHEKWDTTKKETLDKFFKHYPQFKNYPFEETEFSWLWYYAMQQMGDDESANESNTMMTKLEQRNRFCTTMAWFNPSLHTQIQFSEIAKSNLSNQLLFLRETEQFHEKLRLYFYPKIFENQPVEKENWKRFEVATFEDKSTINLINAFLPLLLFFGILFLLGRANHKKSILTF